MRKATLKFANTDRDFSTALNKRVNDYFKTNNLSRTGNAEMVVKTIVMFLIFAVPYAMMLTGVVTSYPGMFFMYIIMGLGVAGIGLSVMHDANHGAYSKKSWVNTTIGYSMNFLGANAFTWKVQHNVLHHSFTNVHEEDEDISPRGALRLTPHSNWLWIHKYQFVYAWFLYGLMTIVWLSVKDFTRLFKYKKNGLVETQKTTFIKECIILLASKTLYISYMVLLPLSLTSYTWWQLCLGILVMHYVAGFILAIIFQPAHVIEGTDFPLADDGGNLSNNWAVHQLLTTTNFGTGNKYFSWYVGGLNFQIEHHLFPNICHVHYRKIATIVKDTAEEFGLPYKTSRTFLSALGSHMRLLKQLGAKPVVQPVMNH